ncbi:hypothetical protein L1987_62526 [Smallanthus sonchifolius]|uniref:Uncharacterized protein n=1 Tax=Smallanthus sonchifolius TaxID=185202 RepID=A0ACB9CAS2_9ASTR|nr:hypothetical protein L1987_62526 [Smallanthus sonchifolius]
MLLKSNSSFIRYQYLIQLPNPLSSVDRLDSKIAVGNAISSSNSAGSPIRSMQWVLLNGNVGKDGDGVNCVYIATLGGTII